MADQTTIDLLLLNPHVADLTDEPGAQVGTMAVPQNYLVRCLNSGILALASYCDGLGYEVAILDFIDDPDLAPLRTLLAARRPRVVGISVLTGFVYPHAKRLARAVRQLCPDTVIVLGGQHVGPLGETALHDIPEADLLALYEGEEVCRMLLARSDANLARRDFDGIPGIVCRTADGIRKDRRYPPLVDLSDIPPWRYDLYPRFQTFLPVVEESRGCFAKCTFCITPFTNNYSIRGKPADLLLAEIDRAIDMWGGAFERHDREIALLASTFGNDYRGTLELIAGIARRDITWNTELRIDGPLVAHLDEIAAAGAKKLFFGIESASPEQLLRMKKTTNPAKYLKRLGEVLTASRETPDLLVKIGLLLFVGETPRTLCETLGFLHRHADDINWVSVSPLYVFEGTPLHREFDGHRRDFGASLHDQGFWADSRTYPCNISRDYSFNEAIETARVIEKLFRNPDVYSRVFDAKDKVAELISAQA